MFFCERLPCLLSKDGLLLVLSIKTELDNVHHFHAIAVNVGAAARTVSLISRIVYGRKNPCVCDYLQLWSIKTELDNVHHSHAIAVNMGAAARTVSLISRIVYGRKNPCVCDYLQL